MVSIQNEIRGERHTLIPPSMFGMAGPLLPDPRKGLASPSISVASVHLPCLTWHCAARYRHATLISTRRDTESACSLAILNSSPGPPTGKRGSCRGSEEKNDNSVSFPFPFAFVVFPKGLKAAFDKPAARGGGGGFVGNGRVRSRSAREY